MAPINICVCYIIYILTQHAAFFRIYMFSFYCNEIFHLKMNYYPNLPNSKALALTLTSAGLESFEKILILDKK